MGPTDDGKRALIALIGADLAAQLGVTMPVQTTKGTRYKVTAPNALDQAFDALRATIEAKRASNPDAVLIDLVTAFTQQIQAIGGDAPKVGKLADDDAPLATKAKADPASMSLFMSKPALVDPTATLDAWLHMKPDRTAPVVTPENWWTTFFGHGGRRA